MDTRRSGLCIVRGSQAFGARAIRGASAALLIAAFSGSAMAQNLVQNGSFAVTGGTTSIQFGTGYSNSLGESVADWTTAGYNFVFLPGSTTAQGSGGSLSLGTSPAPPIAGENYAAADPIYEQGPITQTINGLTIGQTYAVSFAWAEAQQTGFTGTVNDYWAVNLGPNSATTQDTTGKTIATQSFSGWMNQTFDFIATSSSELLSFTSMSPGGSPPFALLTNVSVTQVPEPASVAMVLTGVVGLIGLARRRRSTDGGSLTRA
ncbi:PEP-CTERM sorting domain-containing protein [Acidisphaera sp. S103]|uniref:PEP-CTERM sorting domain-containing protein n=1 Tax=Acidisphaera sp. S103 TaxID=1747223 RepID=UPI00131A9EAD|nr:PEP-CTERM sorting domain-containing protein [Acidisphaera sp. S103]